MEIEDFIDLRPFTEEKDRYTKADRGLVVMFQPFVGKGTQIIGVFASKGNVKAALLLRSFWRPQYFARKLASA
ncbi:hypothetical protein V5799_007376 [Amblyomma americanum]|uniref:Uncharacterized protein n=1 Tax=Amblyomma americanum TaxID=6943 RepID=A0AAQ4DTQ3_AMBAM